MQRQTQVKLGALLATSLLAAACGDGNNGGTDGGPNNDGGTTGCESPFPATSCTGASCSATTGTKTFAMADLDSAKSKQWLVVSYGIDETASGDQNTTINYTKAVKGALTPSELAERIARRRAEIPEDIRRILEDPRHLGRIRGENIIRAAESREPLDLAAVSGTAITGRRDPRLPGNVDLQTTSCTEAAPSCGAMALCVIPEGQTMGMCQSALMIKFLNPAAPPAVMVPATVKKVGMFGAVVVEDGVTMSAGDVDTLLSRFDNHIAPLNHQFFGEPKKAGKDRDRNGVVMLFVTSKVRDIDPNMVGFFTSDDLRPTAQRPNSNAADLLYLQPPGGNINMDDLSGTIGHEYQHIINYYAKVENAGSSQEERWLDEGVSGFAEDMLGYGGDAFTNVLAYLMAAENTSLTTFGLNANDENSADSSERRGMALLMVRYIFEQAGGATFAAEPGMATDKGGIAAVKKIVQEADTGIDALKVASGKSFDVLFPDFMTAVAVDGLTSSKLSCLTKYNFQAPEQVPYTMFQRGIDLRTSLRLPKGTTLPFMGPKTAEFDNDKDVPLPLNGGEFRTLTVPSGVVTVSVGGPADVPKFGLVAIPRD